MSRKGLPYRKGDWFAVPLEDGNYAIGIISHTNNKGILIGYFFSDRYEQLPTLEDAAGKHPEDAILVTRFGDLGFIRGQWSIIGRLPDWRAEDWGNPVFGRIDEFEGKAWRVQYDPESLSIPPIQCERIPVDQAKSLPRDGLMGAPGVADWLSYILCK